MSGTKSRIAAGKTRLDDGAIEIGSDEEYW
jgi:hypothetical protein